ncbi:MAG: hypothetical protein DDT29_02232 [Dehalococcoidia bacterium]|nr:hypothetical protein [Bacillota bacterium]
MASGMGVLVETPYQEKLGFFSNLAEAREFCKKMGLPMPGTSCVPGW